MPAPACTQCAGGTSGGSRACLRIPIMCAKCCRYNGGCARHIVQLNGAAAAPLPQQQQQQALQVPPQPPLPAPPAQGPQPAPVPQLPPQQAPPQAQPDPTAAPINQLSLILQQL